MYGFKILIYISCLQSVELVWEKETQIDCVSKTYIKNNQRLWKNDSAIY